MALCLQDQGLGSASFLHAVSRGVAELPTWWNACFSRDEKLYRYCALGGESLALVLSLSSEEGAWCSSGALGSGSFLLSSSFFLLASCQSDRLTLSTPPTHLSWLALIAFFHRCTDERAFQERLCMFQRPAAKSVLFSLGFERKFAFV